MDANFDDNLGAFVNFDADEQTADIKPTPAMLHQSSAQFAANTQAFPDQTHQYDLWKQQTGLPMGGYANTLALNQASGLHYRPGNGGFVVPNDILNVPLSNLDSWEFGPQSYDMDIESESPADLPSMFYAGDSSSISPAQQAPPRIYPGMHTQQQKIQQAQKQQEMMRQQQQQRQIPGQRPLPSISTTPRTPVVKDPHVEESISRLLSRMRQTSDVSADDDEADSPVNGTSNAARVKKDEDDMDDDERLLNSEEGKRLTSKERRQLRNKVSARAFRSRRKGKVFISPKKRTITNLVTEYITQLESELAGKAQEANELRVQNRQLTEENTRLTDLTRMLLSSQAFSGFLQELSNSNVPNHIMPQNPQQKTSQQPQPTMKDVSSHEAARQIQNQDNQMQVGMTLIPETTFDMSTFDPGNVWNSVLPSNNFQVFSVTELPEPPMIDFSNLSGKSNEMKSTPSASSTKDMPTVSPLPALATTLEVAGDLITSESTDLYDEPSATITLPHDLSITLTKAAAASELLSACSSHQSTPQDSWSQLDRAIELLDESYEKVSELIS